MSDYDDPNDALDAAANEEAATNEEAAAPPRDERRLPPASEKQHKFIQALKTRVELSDEELEKLVREVTDGALEEINIKQASEVIDELKITAREKGIDLDQQSKASEKQVGFIKSLKRKALLTDAEFETLLQKKAGVPKAEDLGKRDASAIIDELIKLRDAGPKASKPKTKVEDDGNYDDVPF